MIELIENERKEGEKVSEIKKNSHITSSNSLAGKVTMAVTIDPRTERFEGLKMSPDFTPLRHTSVGKVSRELLHS